MDKVGMRSGFGITYRLTGAGLGELTLLWLLRVRWMRSPKTYLNEISDRITLVEQC